MTSATLVVRMTRRSRLSVISRLGIAQVLLLVLALSVMTGCGARFQGQELAKVGTETSEALAAYYESLIQDSLEILEMDAFLFGRSVENQKEISTQVQALRYRKVLAVRLGSVYKALMELTSPEATADIKGAAESLVGELISTPAIQGGQVDTKGLFGTLAGRLAEWKQSRDIRKGILLMVESIEGLAKLFKQESSIYGSITEQRNSRLGAVFERLLDNEKDREAVRISWPLLQGATEVFGLTVPSARDGSLAGEPRPGETPEQARINAKKQLIRAQIHRLTILFSGATDSLGEALTALAQNHRSFLGGQAVSPPVVRDWLKVAQDALKEIAKLRPATK